MLAERWETTLAPKTDCGTPPPLGESAEEGVNASMDGPRLTPQARTQPNSPQSYPVLASCAPPLPSCPGQSDAVGEHDPKQDDQAR